MEIVLKVIYIVGAMLVAIGAYMIHLNKPAGAGLVTFGIVLIGIGSGVI